MTKVIKVPESHLEVVSSPLQESQPTALSQLKYAEPVENNLNHANIKKYSLCYFGIHSAYIQPLSISVDFSELPININNLKLKPQTFVDFAVQAEHKLRDGELTLFRRPGSRIWQFKYKQNNGKWHRASTKKTMLDYAKEVACTSYDEGRYREKLGLAPVQKSFREIAKTAIEDMQIEIEAGTAKKIYTDYCAVIENYFIPFFGDRYLQHLKHKDIAAFEAWRNHRMGRTPKHSTLMTFASAFNRVHETAVQRGWLSDRIPIPKLTRKGLKGEIRAGFTEKEMSNLRLFMADWRNKGKLAFDRVMHPLLCNYIDFLIYTGMRHGTESMGVEWKHCEWYEEGNQKYLRIWVDGKTGGRWLIAKHEAYAILEDLHRSQKDIADKPMEQLMGRVSKYIFRRPDGEQPRTFNGMFNKLMRESGMKTNAQNQERTLYSFRHYYATSELLAGTDIHTLARQMGTSVRMLEAHYSKLTATMAAEKLA